MLTDLFSIFQTRYEDILLASWEHLQLTFIALFIANLIAIPLGILLTRHKKWAEPIIGVASVFQTIPSLALLGFMIPFLGIGTLPAIIALTIYGLLPILRNTYTGIVGVTPAAVEAGIGMGMTSMQVLFMVELPMALSVIMAGIRTATVLIIGVATLAALIGAGGLGDLIFRGIAMANSPLILAGALPAAFLAIAFDFALKHLEDKAQPKGLRRL
ncbi:MULTISPECIES: ABC transporter permease [Pelosinus]|jgi:osmoprotectant transport system permease protein|uniref:ABC-type transporter, integral membrane subunit n=1 Tax=Pelosinus fermentans B4 TaxID=1149862 RepID=I9LIA0_9FIRM|nr:MULTISPECIES: ABC transporter permease [Pelosinus]MDF2572240.1 ABC-type transporter, integral rane subunit [Sporomusa sp.]EIW20239.1 ABC-type transporter, integral membrane subunit [Pelosinus fermentans B4]EIW25923.1 ABC-type transporter, integral membrane subunit [Pelosinus fermentans A11]OAM93221.1 ABC-type transporter, integral membrane subunit [Pelosinus fermentans DSM 17108]SDQ70745.1 osmoprotectant transport system permease protein [Pelosinus fermentans]